MADGALLDQRLDSADVIPVMMCEPDFTQPDAVVRDGAKHWIRLRRIDDGRAPIADDQVGVVVAQTRDRNHLHCLNVGLNGEAGQA